MTWQEIHRFDQNLTLKINSWNSSFSDPIWEFLSDIPVWIPMYVLIVAFIIWRLGWKKGLVVVVNKWDLVEDKSDKVMKFFENAIRERVAPFTDFPIIFTSTITKQRVFKVLELAQEVYNNSKNKVSTAKFNEEMLPLIEAYPPPSIKGKYIKIKYCMQLPDVRVPSFIFFANLPQYVKEPYKRFLENKIREKWNFSGVPMNIYIRQK